MEWPEAERFLEEIGPGARRELLRVLDAPAEVRADVIRQFFHRKGGGEMAELLILLEEREWTRQAIVEALRRPRNWEVTAIQAGPLGARAWPFTVATRGPAFCARR